VNIATGIEVYEVTPADLLGAFLAFLVIVLAAVGLGWWAGSGSTIDDGADDEAAAADVDAGADPAETLEIRPRGRTRPHRTGTIHAPGIAVPLDETVVINSREVSRG
jgi:hypothetical protein